MRRRACGPPSVTSTSSIRTRPRVGEKYPTRHRINVLFPDPFGPSKAAVSPVAIRNETSSSACVAP